MPMFDQIAWVADRKYMEQDYKQMVDKLIDERIDSIKWLRSVKNACWENAYQHPKLGPLSTEQFLANWLAHDLLHFRQIIGLRYRYLQVITQNDLSYGELLK